MCDPKKPCPCDVFKEHDVCLCAGERLPVRSEAVGLTQHVHKAGCASKIGQEDLLGILSRLPAVTDPAVLVGTAAGDDAGVYRLSDTMALVLLSIVVPGVPPPANPIASKTSRGIARELRAYIRSVP